MTQTKSDTVTINLDGRPLECQPGELVIAAAERVGTYIPRFCYHPRMRPVGMCRMCLVELVGPRGPSLVPACFQQVAEGQEIHTDTPAVHKAQDGILEFLLVNHPLDCPVCDKGGECPLQDQTLAYGPGESRFVEEKRHWAKPIALSPLVDIDRERCIQCDRCTRFTSEVAGEALINFQGRGDHIEVNTFPDKPFASYFSGNTVQICPVGALLAKPYRFKARPWDLEQVESSCTTCSMGCRVALQSSTGRLVRQLGIDVEGVNQGWLCDKGRFGFEATNSTSRTMRPQRRGEEGWEEVAWSVALADVAGRLRQAKQEHGPSSIAVIGGARLANEDAYAWAKFAKGVLGTDSVDAQLGDGLPAELVLSLPRATIEQACSARAVLLLAADIREEVPVLFLRLRQAAIARTTTLVELATHKSSLSELAGASLRYRPGELGSLVDALLADPTGQASAELGDARKALGLGAETDGSGLVVVLGRPSLAESAGQVTDAARALADALPGARFLPVGRRANLQGALDAGLAPGLLPGRVTLSEGGEWYRQAWGAVPDRTGLDTEEILRSASDGGVDVLVLLGADPLSDFPDPELAKAGLEGAGLVVSIETLPNASTAYADVVLPAAAYGERSGSTTNFEGRVSLLGQIVVAAGLSWPDWIIASELAAALGSDLGFDSLESIRREMISLSPLHSGLKDLPLRGDGVVLPIALGRSATSQQAGSAGAGYTLVVDPMALPGVLSVETQGSPSYTGAAIQATTQESGGESDPVEVGGGGPGSGGSQEPPEYGRIEAVPSGPMPNLLEWAATVGGPGPGALAPKPPQGTAPADLVSPQRTKKVANSAQTDQGQQTSGQAGELALVLTRRLYDCGTAVSASPSLAMLHRSPGLSVNPAELERLGLTEGGQANVSTARGQLLLPVTADAGVPPGVAVMGLNLDQDVGGLSLLSPAGEFTTVRLEKP